MTETSDEDLVRQCRAGELKAFDALVNEAKTLIYDLDGDTIQPVCYEETKHYLITRDFLNSPDRFFKHLLS